MDQWKKATCIAAFSLGLVLSAMPGESDAAVVRRWLAKRWMSGRGLFMRFHQPSPTAFAPPASFVPPTAAGCGCGQPAQQPVVQYLPQTCYRTQWSPVPVTTYRPVISTNPCSSCTTTYLQPCTTYRWQAKRVPYTTYRAVYSNMSVPAMSQTVGTPAVTAQSPGCSTCGTAAPLIPPAYTVPPGATFNPTSPTNPVPAQQQPTLQPGPMGGSSSGIGAPGLNDQSYQRPHGLSPFAQSYQPSVTVPPARDVEQDDVDDAPRLRPVPDVDSDDSYDAPPLLDPRERTAAIPIHLSREYSPIEWPVQRASRAPSNSSVAPVTTWDDGGWQAAR